jgi:hypothetical protein
MASYAFGGKAEREVLSHVCVTIDGVLIGY